MARKLSLNRAQFVRRQRRAPARRRRAGAVCGRRATRDRALELARRLGRRGLAEDDRCLQRRPQGQGRADQDGGRAGGAVRHQGPRRRRHRRAPDFGWGTAGVVPRWPRTASSSRSTTSPGRPDSTSPTSDDFSIKQARYPKYDNGLFMVPMDLMSLQPEVNTDHVKEAGLDPEKFPDDGTTLRLGREDDQARRRHGHALGHHDDRLRRAADGHLGHRRGADGLQARERRLQGGGGQSRRRHRRDAVGARPLRQVQGLDPRRHRPLQGVRHRTGLDLLDRPVDAQRLCRAEAAVPHRPLPEDRRHPEDLFRDGRHGVLQAGR